MPAIVRKAIIAPLTRSLRQYPVSSAMPTMLLPLVDRDGLTKPIVQIIAEEAIESGIESVGLIATSGDERVCREYFRRWSAETECSLRDHDWARLQCEKLAEIGARLTFLTPRDEHDDPAADLLAARAFVNGDDLLLLPIDVVQVSGTKDRAAGQLLQLAAGLVADSLIAVQPILRRDIFHRTVVKAELFDEGRRIFQMSRIIDRPTLEQGASLLTPELPPGSFLAETGMALYSAQLFDVLDEALHEAARTSDPQPSLLTRAQRLLIERSSRSYCVELAATPFDVQLPYGLLEAQLALGLAGIHRNELCEMIARTLAEQAKS